LSPSDALGLRQAPELETALKKSDQVKIRHGIN